MSAYESLRDVEETMPATRYGGKDGIPQDVSIDLPYKAHFARARGPYKDIGYMGVLQPPHLAVALVRESREGAPIVVVSNFHKKVNVLWAMDLLLRFCHKGEGGIKAVVSRGYDDQGLLPEVCRWLKAMEIPAQVVAGPLVMGLKTGELERPRKGTVEEREAFILGQMRRRCYVPMREMRCIMERNEALFSNGGGALTAPLAGAFDLSNPYFARDGFKLRKRDGSFAYKRKKPLLKEVPSKPSARQLREAEGMRLRALRAEKPSKLAC